MSEVFIGEYTYREALLYLVVLEFVLSTATLLVGHLRGNRYFEGVGVGLLIAWVTGILAYGITGWRLSPTKSSNEKLTTQSLHNESERTNLTPNPTLTQPHDA